MTEGEPRRIKPQVQAWLREKARTDRDARYTADHTFDDYPGDGVEAQVQRELGPEPR